MRSSKYGSKSCTPRQSQTENRGELWWLFSHTRGCRFEYRRFMELVQIQHKTATPEKADPKRRVWSMIAKHAFQKALIYKVEVPKNAWRGLLLSAIDHMCQLEKWLLPSFLHCSRNPKLLLVLCTFKENFCSVCRLKGVSRTAFLSNTNRQTWQVTRIENIKL